MQDTIRAGDKPEQVYTKHCCIFIPHTYQYMYTWGESLIVQSDFSHGYSACSFQTQLKLDIYRIGSQHRLNYFPFEAPIQLLYTTVSQCGWSVTKAVQNPGNKAGHVHFDSGLIAENQDITDYYHIIQVPIRCTPNFFYSF